MAMTEVLCREIEASIENLYTLAHVLRSAYPKREIDLAKENIARFPNNQEPVIPVERDLALCHQLEKMADTLNGLKERPDSRLSEAVCQAIARATDAAHMRIMILGKHRPILLNLDPAGLGSEAGLPHELLTA